MTHDCINRLIASGIDYTDATALRRIAITLHRWHELECGNSNDWSSWCITRGRKVNGSFEYDDNGAPYEERHIHTENKARYYQVPDRERGALKRLAKIMAKYPLMTPYVQTDPRGAALYILPDGALSPGQSAQQLYSSRGIAVYK